MGTDAKAPGEFETERLRASRPTPYDFPHFRTLDKNPEVQKTLFGRVYSVEETEARLRKFIAHWDDFGFGEWTFRLRSGEFVGTCGLFNDTIEDKAVVALGYVLDQRFWGQGYATEMAGAAVRVGFADLGLTDIYAVIDPLNAPSRRVLEKTGFIFLRDFIYKEDWPSALFRAEVGRSPAPQEVARG